MITNSHQILNYAIDEAVQLKYDCYMQSSWKSINYFDRFNSILEKVSEANREVALPIELEQHLIATFPFISKRTDLVKDLTSTLLEHRSTLSKRLAWSFFEEVVIAQDGKQAELFDLWAFSGMFTREGAATLLALKLSDALEAPHIHAADFDDLEPILTQSASFEAAIVLQPDPQKWHLLPLIVRKEDDRLTILVLDSLATNFLQASNGEFTSPLLQCLASCLSRLPLQTSLYAYTSQRLFHSDTCSIFTISDILNFYKLKLKCEIDLFEEAKKSIHKVVILSSLLTFFGFDALPTAMMKMTQSLTRIQRLSSHQSQPLIELLRPYFFVASYYCSRSQKILTNPVNMRAAIKFNRYLTYLQANYSKVPLKIKMATQK
ncbi:hypothetical protein PNK_1239 [Candidatus Protochlamydia naegleriophila]|uniref:Uncharacterized protein n=1 Tax=Candidatus Protochlamydia naegleriophila TaxID=389348 RepID=A0A0U5JAM3_9BACT|nr:hypothetical protein [Candidatus Protochlamydia naegleriophila]CUI16856.1 hypothetical protein PNK_1239 [Candidatus Protochlamydia naegleriophila]